jgi:hypothetical protein
VARVLFDEVAKLTAGRLKPTALIPSLRDKRVLLLEDGGGAITVRDLAFAMLEEANVAKLPIGSTRVKLICGCDVHGEWYRFHIPELTDQDFEVMISIIQEGRGEK